MRPLLLLATVLLAACGSRAPRTGGTVDNAGHAVENGQALSVELGAPDPELGDGWSPNLRPAAGSTFPAASADGTTIVDLVEDAEDFSGIPITSLVFWTKDGKAEAFRLQSASTEDVPPDQAARAAKVVADANARLARQRWVPLAVATGHDAEDGEDSTLALADGASFTLRAVEDRFPSPGDGSAEIGGGGCGAVTGLASGYGSRALGFAVLFPRVNLGGDSCFGRPSADLAIVVPVP